MYSNLVIDKKSYSLSDEIVVTVDVKNSGKRAGKEVVQLYARDHFATISPPLRKLVRYNKIALKPKIIDNIFQILMNKKYLHKRYIFIEKIIFCNFTFLKTSIKLLFLSLRRKICSRFG